MASGKVPNQVSGTLLKRAGSTKEWEQCWAVLTPNKLSLFNSASIAEPNVTLDTNVYTATEVDNCFSLFGPDKHVVQFKLSSHEEYQQWIAFLATTEQNPARISSEVTRGASKSLGADCLHNSSNSNDNNFNKNSNNNGKKAYEGDTVTENRKHVAQASGEWKPTYVSKDKRRRSSSTESVALSLPNERPPIMFNSAGSRRSLGIPLKAHITQNSGKEELSFSIRDGTDCAQQDPQISFTQASNNNNNNNNNSNNKSFSNNTNINNNINNNNNNNNNNNINIKPNGKKTLQRSLTDSSSSKFSMTTVIGSGSPPNSTISCKNFSATTTTLSPTTLKRPSKSPGIPTQNLSQKYKSTPGVNPPTESSQYSTSPVANSPPCSPRSPKSSSKFLRQSPERHKFDNTVHGENNLNSNGNSDVPPVHLMFPPDYHTFDDYSKITLSYVGRKPEEKANKKRKSQKPQKAARNEDHNESSITFAPSTNIHSSGNHNENLQSPSPSGSESSTPLTGSDSAVADDNDNDNNNNNNDDNNNKKRGQSSRLKLSTSFQSSIKNLASSLVKKKYTSAPSSTKIVNSNSNSNSNNNNNNNNINCNNNTSNISNSSNNVSDVSDILKTSDDDINSYLQSNNNVISSEISSAATTTTTTTNTVSTASTITVASTPNFTISTSTPNFTTSTTTTSTISTTQSTISLTPTIVPTVVPTNASVAATSTTPIMASSTLHVPTPNSPLPLTKILAPSPPPGTRTSQAIPIPVAPLKQPKPQQTTTTTLTATTSTTTTITPSTTNFPTNSPTTFPTSSSPTTKSTIMELNANSPQIFVDDVTVCEYELDSDQVLISPKEQEIIKNIELQHEEGSSNNSFTGKIVNLSETARRQSRSVILMNEIMDGITLIPKTEIATSGGLASHVTPSTSTTSSISGSTWQPRKGTTKGSTFKSQAISSTISSSASSVNSGEIGSSGASQGSMPVTVSGKHREGGGLAAEDVMKLDEEEKLKRLKSLKDSFITQGDPHKKYNIKNKSIGKGSVGDVIIASTRHGNTKIAIKKLELVRRGKDRLPLILREIEIIATSAHPNIVQYIESYEVEEELWVVMEFMSGGSLYDIVKLYDKGIFLTEQETAYAVREVLSALAFLHSRKRVHRDIKVDNILLHLDGSVKLADFGTAVQLTFQRIRRQTLAGTPYYMAPELIQRIPYKEEVDIWSVGITVLEVMTGRPPFYDLDPQQALEAIITYGVEGIVGDEYSNEIKDFCNNKCLKINAEERATAEALLQHPFLVKTCTKEAFGDRIKKIQATSYEEGGSGEGCLIL